ncbi:MAG: Omp28-related outer membrane protein [Marinifilaceae bacterium]
MKKISIKLIALLSVIFFASCSGDETTFLKLSASVEQASVDQEIVLSLFYEDADVTSDAVFYVGKEKLTSNKYVPSKEGVYTFTAQYKGEFSNEVKVKVVGESLLFVKNAVWFRFTSVSCRYCPNMEPTAEKLKEKHGNRVSVLAFHTNYVTDQEWLDKYDLWDPFALADCGHYEWWSNAIGGYPKGVVDCDIPYSEGAPVSLVTNHLTQTAKVGLKLSTKIEDGQMTITAYGKFAESLAQYKEVALAVWITETNLKANQLTPSAEVNTNYIHHDVVRLRVTPADGQTLGEVIPTAECVKGNEVSYSYTVNVANYKLENTKVIAYIYTNDGKNVDSSNGRLVQNSIEVVAGESKEYQILN